jgi:uncharacterized coiled-coil protein SlyX
MTKKRPFLLAATLLALFFSPLLSAIEDCGTSVTECELRSDIKKLQSQNQLLVRQLAQMEKRLAGLERFMKAQKTATLEKLNTQQQQIDTLQKRIAFLTKENQRLRQKTDTFTVSSDGNIGIGTTSPRAKLHVNGDARFNTVGGGAFDGGSGIKFDLGEIQFAALKATACKKVNFDLSFSKSPKVFATVNHHQNSGFGVVLHDPMTVWIEEITTTACEICVREVDSDVSHDPVFVDWLAIGN